MVGVAKLQGLSDGEGSGSGLCPASLMPERVLSCTQDLKGVIVEGPYCTVDIPDDVRQPLGVMIAGWVSAVVF